MAYIYNVEPTTNGKVVLHTSNGDVDIELWSDQAPLACRNFIQLCLEGYYDGTIFHRLIKDMMIQGGDPTGTGNGGESIYNGPFKDEINPRLKFSHRGIVAMANENNPDTNHSQFFITLKDTTWLNGKHTIFGKVTGDTLFNVLKMGELATDSNDRPLYPPMIKSVTVITNPFSDIVPREIKKKDDDKNKTTGKKKLQPVKNNKLLSFADDDEDSEDALHVNVVCKQEASGIVQKKPHIPINTEKKESEWAKKLKEQIRAKEEEKLKEQQNTKQTSETPTSTKSEGNAPALNLSADELMKEKIKNRLKEMKLNSAKKEKEKEKRNFAKENEDKWRSKRRRNESNADRAKDTRAALEMFRNRLKMAKQEEENNEPKEEDKKTVTQNDLLATSRTDIVDDQDDDSEEENGTMGWMNHKLKFVKHFEDNLRDSSFEPGADMYYTNDPLEDNPNMLESVRDKVEMRKRPQSTKRGSIQKPW